MSNPRNILIGVAWPYANGEQHIGHIAGAYLPPDIFARFHRMRGNDVLMVSGSDTHGTPVAVKAEEEGVTPLEIVGRYHPLFIENYLRLGITFDLFTHTDTENHWATTHELFQTHLDKGYIYKDTQSQLFDPQANKFLPDRYVEGTCPKCGYEHARGDQCDNCGAIYDAVDLLNPRSKQTGNTGLEVRETEHFFLDLGKLNDSLLEWINQPRDHWRTNVLNFTRSQLAEKKLRGRPITRDMSWGITIPLPGYDEKRIYVWYDAVIGYLSASREWSLITTQPDAWQTWWSPEQAPDARHYYFIGKDNIPFHTIIWPGMLTGAGELNLPYDVPANEYLNMKGRKFSKSRGAMLTIRSVLDRYQPDAWRYALTAMAPETSDVDFTWDDFVERVNNELIANWGNLVNRMLSFAYKRFDGEVPQFGERSERDKKLLEDVHSGFDSVAALYEACKFKGALQELNRLSGLVNLYITETAPFTLIKEDKDAAATVVHTALQCISWLNVMWGPILPHSTQAVAEMLDQAGPFFGRQFTETVKDARGEHLVLRYDHNGATGVWKSSELFPGTKLRPPVALFTKLDPDTAEKEMAGDQA